MDAGHWGQLRLAGGGRAALIEPPPGPVEALARSWDALCHGHARIAREYSNEAGHHVELMSGQTRGPSTPELEMLTRVVLGEPQKAVALSEQRSASSVATLAASALRSFGLGCRPRETPLMIVMMARAWHGWSADFVPVECRVTELGPRISLLSVSRPDGWLNGVLSPCERKVLRARVDGSSHDDVARVFAISRRTVANQIASGYKKLGVSGRLELLNRILVPGLRAQAAPRRERPQRLHAIGAGPLRPVPAP